MLRDSHQAPRHHSWLLTLLLLGVVGGARVFADPPKLSPASVASAHPAPAAVRTSNPLPLGSLANSPSLYLRQSASAAVRWQPFDDQSFALARKLDRPVLLDIGATWCHWCRVMDSKTYSDPAVAAVINQEFVPIRVDRDLRPDIDSYYQHAAADFAGAGGWPLTCFTLPDGSLFAAYGYLPEHEHGLGSGEGPTMAAVLKQIAAQYKTQRAKLDNAASALKQRIGKDVPLKGKDNGTAPVAEILSGIANAYDRSNGGFSFGGGPKFYEFPALELALAEGFWGRQDFAQMASVSLERMARGGVYDQLGGGFFRYSIDQAWLVPHFEKMAYDQALAVKVYAHAYERDPRALYARIARGTLDYVLNTLYDPSRKLFYGAQDADAWPDDDGAYYTWKVEEIRKLLSPAQYRVAALALGVEFQPAQAADGGLVLHRPLALSQVAQKLNLSLEEARGLLRQAKDQLLAARGRRPAPQVDPALLTDRNALMDGAFLAAAETFKLPRLREIALANLDYLTTHARLADGSYGHVIDQPSAVQGLGADQIYLLDALLDGYQDSGQPRYLSQARELAQVIARNFVSNGLVVNHEPESQAAVLGDWRGGSAAYYDGETPSLQGVLARDLVVLGVLSRDQQAVALGTRLLGDVPISARAGMMLATVGRALAERGHGDALVQVAGGPADPRTQSMLAAAEAVYRPGKILMPMDGATGPHDRGTVSARVCAGTSCSSSMDQTKELEDAIRNFGLSPGRS
ncbi:MAG TPA: DUF255 domain-containing protein [Candidatus Binataceae bacterium]|nr:DUF255 domain-containing protein [Candidatus Binataceae bacterium]